MKQEQVIELARKAGFTGKNGWYEVVVRHSNGAWIAIDDELEQFAALVEQATLEQAALEAQQAEVHMPEPIGKVSKQGWASWNGVVREGEQLYTESQLRTLLSQHGIKIA